jgi:hypothetical protein
MTDLFDPLGTQSLWLGLFILALVYFVVVWGIRAFLRPVIVGNLDPLNINLILFTGPALMGLLVAPYFTKNYSKSYFLILLFLGVWLSIIRLAGKPKKIDLRDTMRPDFQIALLSLALLIIISNVIVNMIIPGTIPLLAEGGAYSRFDATQNSRLLSWLSMGTSPMPGLIFAVTQNSRVRRLATIAVVVQTVAGLLFANKSAILSILFVLLNAMLVAKIRNETVRYRNILKWLLRSGVLVACLAPFYLSIIGLGDGQSVLVSLGVRFLGGFDQLIYTSQFDLLQGNGFGSLIHVNLIEYQLMPFFKAVLSTKYDYSTIGQYVLEMATGISIEGPFTFPNSNLILETVFTSGIYLGLVAFVFESVCFYRCRIAMLKRPITPFSLVLLYGTFFQPFGLFLSGQEWIMEIIVAFLTVILAIALTKLWNSATSSLRVSSTANAR